MRIKISMLLAVALGLYSPALATWTDPVPVTEVNLETGSDGGPFLSFDRLTLYFSRWDTDEFYYGRIYRATRDIPSGPFTLVTEVSELNRAATHVLGAWVSPDNLRMYYHIESSSGWDLMFTERSGVGDLWPQGISISELNILGTYLQLPRLAPDELTIFFNARNMAGGEGQHDLWMATRADTHSPFGNVRNLSDINTGANEAHAFPSLDGLELYFASDRNGEFQAFKASRESLDDPFGSIEHLVFLDTLGGYTGGPALSSDETAIYFVRQGAGARTPDIYVSYIPEPGTFLLLGLGAVMLWNKRSQGTA